MRIASLVPSATEMLFALGLGDQVVGVTHECDFPAEASSRPRLTRSIIPDGLEAGEIDEAVRDAIGSGRALYELDEPTLRELDVELIATQALCEVCAVSYDDVRAVAESLPRAPAVISLDPERLDDVLDDVIRLGDAASAHDAAAKLRATLD
ncbi:MAG: cobalamin-binding protein, partial [Actinomycetota bacterium]|nr:cobalamin-binding protein [Actinomycetota bacterium]